MSTLRNRLPPGLQFAIASHVSEKIQDWVVERSITGHLDWERTPSFRVASGGEGCVRFNIKGREANGFFAPDGNELADYAAWLEERLLEIRVAATGQPLIGRVLRTKEIFPGSRGDLLPDLVLEWAPEAPAEEIYSERLGRVEDRLRTGRGGNHTGGAFMLVTGPGASDPEIERIESVKDIGAFARACLYAQR